MDGQEEANERRSNGTCHPRGQQGRDVCKMEYCSAMRRRTPLTRRACGTSHRMIRKNSLFLKNWRSSKKDDRVVSPWENACPTQSKTLTHILDWLVVKEPHQLYSLGVAIFRRKRCQQRELAS